MPVFDAFVSTMNGSSKFGRARTGVELNAALREAKASMASGTRRNCLSLKSGLKDEQWSYIL